MVLVVEDVLRFVKLTENAHAPTKGTEDAAGFDLYSAYDYEVPPAGKVLALTDIQIAVPHDCYGRVAPRSGLAHKNFIDVGAGVIDRDYRGNVGVILFNFGKQVFKGEQIELALRFFPSQNVFSIIKVYFSK